MHTSASSEYLDHAKHIQEIVVVVICFLHKLIIIAQKCAPQYHTMLACPKITEHLLGRIFNFNSNICFCKKHPTHIGSSFHEKLR